jgi:hypothetical protein
VICCTGYGPLNVITARVQESAEGALSGDGRQQRKDPSSQQGLKLPRVGIPNGGILNHTRTGKMAERKAG